MVEELNHVDGLLDRLNAGVAEKTDNEVKKVYQKAASGTSKAWLVTTGSKAA